MKPGDEVTTACPSCGDVATRTVYDIGSGPELSCPNCEWCWGALGQALKPITMADVAVVLAQLDSEKSKGQDDG